MAEPVSIAVITGLVTLMTAYMQYRSDTARHAQAGAPAPAQSDETRKGAQVTTIVRQGVAQHGTDDEQATLALYEKHPERFQSAIEATLVDIARRAPSFADQLQQQANQIGTQTGGIHGTVNVQGDNYGQSTGVNTGTMTQTNTGWPPKKERE